MIDLFLIATLAAQPPPPPREPTDDRRDASAKVSQAEALTPKPETTRVNESKGLLTIMPKRFHEYRSEAANLNEAALQQGQPEPIPDYATLRLKPLARKVLQARLDAAKPTSTQEAK